MESSNTQRMREALDAIVHLVDEQYQTHGDYGGKVEVLGRISAIAADALATPIRNCDVGTPADWEDAFERYMLGHVSSTAWRRDKYMSENWFIYSRWLGCPCEESEKKGDDDGSK